VNAATPERSVPSESTVYVPAPVAQTTGTERLAF
jgi:hypothetical protein